MGRKNLENNPYLVRANSVTKTQGIYEPLILGLT